MKKILTVIPARGGSKGVPGKNIKLLNGKPLIQYTIEVARQISNDKDICVSTDESSIIDVVNEVGLKVPFTRPAYLADDYTSSYDVLLHSINFYMEKGFEYDLLLLLQPTSPFRKVEQVKAAISSWEEGMDMIVSVKETKSNPYYTLFEEDSKGFLQKSKTGNFTTRQKCPVVYELNGAIYLIDIKALLRGPTSTFTKVKKVLMDEVSSIDIDTLLDWKLAEIILSENIL